MRSEHPAAAVGGDATPAGRPQPRSIPTALVLGRHLVGWVLACGVIAYFAFGYRAVTDWLVLLAVVLVLAGTVTGAAALFFTRTQAAKSTGNFILSAWVFIGLIALGTPNGLKYLSSQSLAPTSTGAPSAASQAEAPPTQFSDESLPTMAFRRDGRARKPAWSPGGIDDASLPVDALMESAKRIPALAETRAWSAVLAW